MSLVNKMLRDLDARRAGDGERAALPAAVTPLAAHREPGRGAPRLWLVAFPAMAVLGMAAWYLARPDKPAAPAAVPPVAPAVVVDASVTLAAEAASLTPPPISTSRRRSPSVAGGLPRVAPIGP